MSKYKAFISYSHANDLKIARIIHASVQKFTRKWYELRAFKIFRDENNLSANYSLWDSIKKGLEQSEYLILIASKSSSKSKWVYKEIEWWIKHKNIKNIIIVLINGNIVWGDNDIDWGKTNALPKSFKNKFKDEPLYLDARHEKYSNSIASISSIILGKNKDEIYGNYYKERKKRKYFILFSLIVFLVFTYLIYSYYYKYKEENFLKEKEERKSLAKNISNSALLAIDNPSANNGYYNDALIFSIYANEIDSSYQSYKTMLQVLRKGKYFYKKIMSGVEFENKIKKLYDGFFVLYNNNAFKILSLNNNIIKLGAMNEEKDTIISIAYSHDNKIIYIITKLYIKKYYLNKLEVYFKEKIKYKKIKSVKKSIIFKKHIVILSNRIVYIYKDKQPLKKIPFDSDILDFVIKNDIIYAISNDKLFLYDAGKIKQKNLKNIGSLCKKNMWGTIISNDARYIACYSLTRMNLYDVRTGDFIKKNLNPGGANYIWRFSDNSYYIHAYNNMYGIIKTWVTNKDYVSYNDIVRNNLKNNSLYILFNKIDVKKYAEKEYEQAFLISDLVSGNTSNIILSLDESGVVRIFDILKNDIEINKKETGKKYIEIDENDGYANIISIFLMKKNRYEGNYLIRSIGDTLRGWDFKSNKEILFNNLQDGKVIKDMSMFFSPTKVFDFKINKHILAVGGHGLLIYDIKNKKYKYSKLFDSNYVEDDVVIWKMKFISDYEIVYLTNKNKIFLFDFENKTTKIISSLDDVILSFDYLKKENKIIIGTSTGIVYIGNPKNLKNYKISNKKIKNIKLISNGDYYSYIDGNEVIVRHTKNNIINSVFKNDSEVIDYDVRNNLIAIITKMEKLTDLDIFKIYSNKNIKYSEFYRRLESSKKGKNISLWNLNENKKITMLSLQKGATNIHFDEDDNLVIYNEKYVKHWPTNLKKIACDKVVKDRTLVLNSYPILSNYRFPCD